MCLTNSIIPTSVGINTRGHRNSDAFSKAPRREADSQPISQSVRQAASQAVGWASRQADRQAETHSLAFFFSSHGLYLQTVGNPNHGGTSGDRVVQHSLFSINAGGLDPG